MVLSIVLLLFLTTAQVTRDGASTIELRHPAEAQSLIRLTGPQFTPATAQGPARMAARGLLGGALSRPGHAGGELVIGDDPPDEELVITGPYEFEGTIFVVNQGRLLFDHAEARIRGSFAIMNEGRVDVHGGSLTFESSYLYQFTTVVVDQARFHVVHARLDYVGGTHGIYAGNDARLWFADVQSNGAVTASFEGRARLSLTKVDRAGEFVIMGQNPVEMRDCHFIILWLTFGAGQIADLTLPDGAEVPSFQYPVPPYRVGDPGWRVKLEDCREVYFTLMTRAGCDLTLRDGMVRAVGIIFDGGEFALDGLVNGQRHEAYQLPLTDRRIALRDAGVETWNVYPMLGAIGTIDQCVLGETLVMGGEVEVTYCLYDMTGGFFSSMSGSLTTLLLSGVISPITVREGGLLVMAWCGTPAGEVRIDSGGVFVAVATPLRVRPKVAGSGLSALGWFEAPVDPKVGDAVVIAGTAVIDGGPDWPDDLASFVLEYASAATPDTWWPIAVGYSDVWWGPLGTWDTSGLEAGDYILRLTFTDLYGNAVEVTEDVHLE
ncbi:MAG: hypothetical protein AB1486_03905 [Planctomycetota bacterium]